MSQVISVKDFFAVGDGIADDSAAFQQALDASADVVRIPQGRYKICKTLLIPSDTAIEADPNARIFLDGDTPKAAGDFLLTNSDHRNGNRNISVRGGIWDGNNTGKYNTKGSIFALEEYSGSVLNFFNVRNLMLSDLIVANSVTYFVRMAKLDGFRMDNIGFLSDVRAFNQDGLHFNGEVRNGVVRNIRALSKGQTNDDLIALNADDSMERVENVGMVRGNIENILFENLYAEDCHTIIRILSVSAAIQNITIRNVYGGYRCYAINMDAARYCQTPLFSDSEFPDGVGKVENVLIENMTCFSSDPSSKTPAVCAESLAEGFRIRNFRLFNNDPERPAALFRNIGSTSVRWDQNAHTLTSKEDCLKISNFQNLEISHTSN